MAVAASSAFPPFLSPVILNQQESDFVPNSGTELQRPPFTTRILLTDGGVYDNLGLETAWKKYQTTRATEAEIRDWFVQFPNMNIGIVTGAISNIVVIDVDTYKGTVYEPTSETINSNTGGGGKHYIFKHPGTEVKNSEGKIAQFVDVRGDGGYFIAPPSIHKSGKAYSWNISPWNV